jgi:hypothetical protein
MKAPTVHQMVVSLARKGLIGRTPGTARSIRVLVDPRLLPPLPGHAAPADSAPASQESSVVEAVVTVANRIVNKLCEGNETRAMDDREIVPLFRRLLEGVEEGLVEVGVGPLGAERARQRVLAHAEGLYRSTGDTTRSG